MTSSSQTLVDHKNKQHKLKEILGERKPICACLHDLVVLWFFNIPMHLCLVLYENLQNTDVWEMKFFSQIEGEFMVGIWVYLFLYAQSISYRTNTVLTWMAVIFDQSLDKHHA